MLSYCPVVDFLKEANSALGVEQMGAEDPLFSAESAAIQKR
jgi:hypothetical protein